MINEIIKKIMWMVLLTFALICIRPTNLHSEVNVSINDTTITSDNFTIWIDGSTDFFTGKNVEYRFVLSYAACVVYGIETNDNFALPNSSYNFNYDEATRLLTVSSNQFKSNFTGILFGIKVSILPSVEFYLDWQRMMIVTTQSLTITENEKDSTITFEDNQGIVYVNAISSNQTFIEQMSASYPNPFAYNTTILFSIDEPTNVKFYLHSFAGAILQTIPIDILGAFAFHIYDSFNNEVIATQDYIFPKGIYKLALIPNREQISVGHYRLLFETNKTKSSINISFIN